MIENKLDTNDMEVALYELLKLNYDGIIYCGNRPSIINEKEPSFIVVSVANGGSNSSANHEVISSRKVCAIQIWTRDLGYGMKNMQLESSIRKTILTLIPAIAGNYKFTYMNDVGTRDLLGFHGKYINLNCYVI